MIAVHLSKQQAISANPKAKEQINSTGNLKWDKDAMFFIIEEAKETHRFFARSC